MKIGLFDIDGHNFPNLALMKLSAWHKSKNDCVEFVIPYQKYDVVYKSKVFTFSLVKEISFYSNKIIEGGIGFIGNYKVLPDEIEHICPDYSLYGCDKAYGFLTRGCIRKCSFCVVPIKEGKIRPNADIEEFLSDKKIAILLDNNVLAHEWGISQIEKIIELKIKVDFNQGLDARLIDKYIASLLSHVKWFKHLRLSCDSDEQIDAVVNVIQLLRKYDVTPKQYFIYMLVTDDIDCAYKRANILKKLKCDPFAQAFVSSFAQERIRTQKQKDFCRWVNHKAIFKSIDWKDYNKNYNRKFNGKEKRN